MKFLKNIKSNFFQLKQRKLVWKKNNSKCSMLSSDVGCKLRGNIRKIMSPFARVLHVWVAQCSTGLVEGSVKLHLLVHAMSRHNCQESLGLKMPSRGFFFTMLAAKRRWITLITAAGIKRNTGTAFFFDIHDAHGPASDSNP